MKFFENLFERRELNTSEFSLIFANIMPLVGVVFFGWDLYLVLFLFWAESAVIGFFHIFKIIKVAKWGSLFFVPFFVTHYGAFMAGHFIFLNLIFQFNFLEDFSSNGTVSILDTFSIIALPMMILVLSHGISLLVNFFGKKEYEDPISMKDTMMKPYSRIVTMHLTIIFGSFLVLLFNNQIWSLALLIFLKTISDLSAHKKEHSKQVSLAGIEPTSTP